MKSTHTSSLVRLLFSSGLLSLVLASACAILPRRGVMTTQQPMMMIPQQRLILAPASSR